MSEQTNETTCPHCGGPGCEVCSWTGTVSVDPSRRRQRAPGDGSAAVPSEPRQWTKADAIEVAARAEFESMKDSVLELEFCEWATLPEADGELPTPRSKAYYREQVSTGVEALARAHMLVEEVGPVSEAAVEAGARALAVFSTAHQDPEHPYEGSGSDYLLDMARAVLSAAREVKSDG